jgi:hypothetical protein
MNIDKAIEAGGGQHAAAVNQLRDRDAVRVSNPTRGAVEADVLHTTTPAQLPAMPHVWDKLKTASVRRILESWSVSQIALIHYRYGPPERWQDVCFFALQIAGRWYDLKRQELTIEPMEPQE